MTAFSTRRRGRPSLRRSTPPCRKALWSASQRRSLIPRRGRCRPLLRQRRQMGAQGPCADRPALAPRVRHPQRAARRRQPDTRRPTHSDHRNGRPPCAPRSSTSTGRSPTSPIGSIDLDGEKDWIAFFRDMQDDQPIGADRRACPGPLHKAVEAQHGLDAVLIVTARPDRADWRQTTLDWLECSWHSLMTGSISVRRATPGPISWSRPPSSKAAHPGRRLRAGSRNRRSPPGGEDVARPRHHDPAMRARRAGHQPLCRETLLHMLVGPCGAGKSTYAAKDISSPHDIVATDALRLQLYGNLGHAPEALARVWKLAHGLIRARLDAGAFTVPDATHLDADHRARGARPPAARGLRALYRH